MVIYLDQLWNIECNPYLTPVIYYNKFDIENSN